VATFTFPEIMGSEHSAIYMCNASNPRGMVFKTFTIRVRGKRKEKVLKNQFSHYLLFSESMDNNIYCAWNIPLPLLCGRCDHVSAVV
jgi:hypothetical protein